MAVQLAHMVPDVACIDNRVGSFGQVAFGGQVGHLVVVPVASHTEVGNDLPGSSLVD